MTRNELFSSNSIRIYNTWIVFLNDYELKIMIFLLFNTNSKGIFKGNLVRISEFLNVKSNSTMNKNFRLAIEALSDRGLIEYTQVRKELTIKLLENDSKDLSACFKKAWIKELMNFNYDAAGKKINTKISVSWIKILKVFAYTFINTRQGQLITSKQIASSLFISASTVDEAFKAMKNCHFEGLAFEKRVQRIIRDEITEKEDGQQETIRTYRNIGSTVEYGINLLEFEDV